MLYNKDNNINVAIRTKTEEFKMQRNYYFNTRTNQSTDRAQIALVWHNSGDDIQVTHFDPLRTSEIKGAPKKSGRDENWEWCKSIANHIDDYCEGRVFRCPECGEIITIDDDREKHLCGCGYLDDIDEYEMLSIYDYFDDVYDIEYRIGSDKELRSVCLMIACGGPNIYVDTGSKNVELYWWTERASYPLSSNAVASIDEFAEELYQC